MAAHSRHNADFREIVNVLTIVKENPPVGWPCLLMGPRAQDGTRSRG